MTLIDLGTWVKGRAENDRLAGGDRWNWPWKRWIRGCVIADPGTVTGELSHLALFYEGAADYLSAVRGWLEGARARAEPVFAAVPGAVSAQLQSALPGASPDIQFADMAELGRNPARIITAFLAFAAEHAGSQVCCLSEPVWPSRSAAEVREAARNEALLNVAMAGMRATVMCTYNTAELRPSVIATARRTHPAFFRDGAPQQSPVYPRSGAPAAWDRPLPLPPRRAASLTYDTDLAVLRDFVVRQAGRSGLGAERAADLVLSASEVAANTLRHTSRPGTVIAWHTADEFLCQITDTGQITDPLAGLRPPSEERLGGQGLWVVNKVCDLVELRTGPNGTTIRLHMRLGPV
jgi:anti-sigma regulatory factor (Ser/Thr protein kinase)